jgi:DNA-binding transcriptional LysR family regulator
VQWDQYVGRRLKLRDLYILIAVVQAKNMSTAATRLNMSQPAVSKAIAELEQACGVRLLDRNRQGIEPTQYGRTIIKRGVAVFDELRQGVRDIEFLADPTAGELRIGCSEAIAAGPVLAVVDQLTRRYPRIAFHVVTGDPARLSRDLTDRSVELVITRLTGSLPPEHVVLETLFDDSVVVAAGLKNRWVRRRKIELAELVNEPWVLPSFDNFAGAVVLSAFRAHGLEPPRATVMALSLNMRNELLATGRFLTVIPGFLLTLPAKHRSLKALSVELPDNRATIGIVTLKNRTLSPLAELFVEHARDVTKALAQRRR